MRSSLASNSTPQLRPDAGDPWQLDRKEVPTPWLEAIGPLVLLLAGFCAVIVFFPPEGRVAGPLHAWLAALLGRATFMLPLGLASVGIILLVHRARPDVAVPRRRLAGVAVIAVTVTAIEQFIANGRDGTGLVGEWLSGSLLDLFGGPLTTVVLVALLGIGVGLAFDLKWPRATPTAPPPPPDAAG